jgi:glycosyltransferase involved in cell wall biosynthesis
MRSVSIPLEISKYLNNHFSQEELCDMASSAYKKLSKGAPEVSIVIPAYNEEDNIVATLTSLCMNLTKRSVEIIVVNNNSKDRTQILSEACGVKCVFQSVQGITVSRNMGLSESVGKYILNADADSIYPPNWIDRMVDPLRSDGIALTYGRFALIPTGSTGRMVYFFYEYLAEFSRWINSKIKDQAVNVYGFNSGFRKHQGIEVDGFNHPPGTNEDGWLALKLRNKGYGKLFQVRDMDAIVWTTDRRIQLDGGLIRGFWLRLKRTITKK